MRYNLHVFTGSTGTVARMVDDYSRQSGMRVHTIQHLKKQNYLVLFEKVEDDYRKPSVGYL